MPVTKPYRLTVRQFADGHYTEGGRYRYILAGGYSERPSNYTRAFLLLQKDLLELFNYIEPGDANLQTFSLRIQELLIRTCIELEANFKAILSANTYTKPGNLTIKDYYLIEKTHFLSEYDVKLPFWTGDPMAASREPFRNWANPTDPQKPWVLPWYQAYNATKHDRANSLEEASFDSLITAFSGLVVIMTAQYLFEDFSPSADLLAMNSGWNDGYDPAIGDYFRVHLPQHIPDDHRYDFDWNTLSSGPEPFDKIDFNEIARQAGLS